MPMNWTPEADAKLLAKIIQICDVKVSSDKLKEIAEAMGPDCTPKAVTHRISKFRSLAKEDGAEAQEDGTATPKAKATKLAAGPKKRGKKAAAERTPSPVEEGEEGILTPPDTAAKRARGAGDAEGGEGEDDEESPSKKVKVEDAEVEGEAEVDA